MGRIFAAISLSVILSQFAIAEDFEAWLTSQNKFSQKKLLEQIHPEGTAPGVVIASPSRHNPDYFYHWVRDAALVMDVLVRELERTDLSFGRRTQFNRILRQFVSFSRTNQLSKAPTGLGEPKFHVDGRPYTGPWGRPQNDGPALRALVLTRWARMLLKEGRKDYVLKKLYRAEIPAHTVIKADLEYVSHHWRTDNFDLWEEVKGQHFYTRLAQYQSLVEGAELAKRLGDSDAAKWYRQQAKELHAKLSDHWDDRRKRIVATVDRTGGIDYKHSGLDASVLLSLLHTRPTRLFKIDNPRLLSTLRQLEKAFSQIYKINRDTPELGVAIGRYPEDQYYGGNPWILTTAAYAEFYYKLARFLKRRGHVTVNPTNLAFYRALLPKTLHRQSLRLTKSMPEFRALIVRMKERGDNYMKRIRRHTPASKALWEQMDRRNGFMKSARDLTWSYASFITAMSARRAIDR